MTLIIMCLINKYVAKPKDLFLSNLKIRLVAVFPRFLLFIPLTALVTVLCTVFIVDEFLWEGVKTAKYFWFSSAMFITLPLIFVLFLLERKIIIALRRADIFFLLLWGYIILNFCLLNTNQDIRFLLSLLMLPLYIVIRMAICGGEQQRWFLIVLLVIILIEALWGLLQLYGFTRSQHSLYKITGTLFNPGPFSGFVAVGVPLALSFSLNKIIPHARLTVIMQPYKCSTKPEHIDKPKKLTARYIHR